MSIPLEILLGNLMKANWWPLASQRFKNILRLKNGDRVLILYNADADGFVASYFVYKTLRLINNGTTFKVLTRAIWNYEYDFEWLPHYLSRRSADVIICLDIPIIQEKKIIRKIATTHRIAIYDHHILPDLGIANIKNLLYLNSRILDVKVENHPTSAFTAAIASQLGAIVEPEYLVLAMGLIGDRALKRYPELFEYLQIDYPELLENNNEWKSQLASFTSRLNALFRAYPGKTPPKVQASLAQMIASRNPFIALERFSQRFKLEEAQALVNKEVAFVLNKLTTTENFDKDNIILCLVPGMRTFSVGIVATILAEQRFSSIVALGFVSKDRVQFELRVAEENDIDLTKILQAQHKLFKPLTSGGHPKAAGALVRRSDVDIFCHTLKVAVINAGISLEG